MNFTKMSSSAIAEELGNRLKQARLRADLKQSEVALRAGLSRKTILNAEQGKVQLENLIAILQAMEMVEQLNSFLPAQEISPLQLAKLKGGQRQRASRSLKKESEKKKDDPSW